jgi:hypothetical protein
MIQGYTKSSQQVRFVCAGPLKGLTTRSDSLIVSFRSIVRERKFRKHLRVRRIAGRNGLESGNSLFVPSTVVQYYRLGNNVSGLDQWDLLALHIDNTSHAEKRNTAPKSSHDNSLKTTSYIIAERDRPRCKEKALFLLLFDSE